MNDLTEATPATPLSRRIVTLDAVRGVAVMGILLLNIIDFAMPGQAYVDPRFYGGADGANWWTWAIVYVLFDGKMRGLFTMMFGASMVLIAERAEASGRSAANAHYARLAVLFLFGMVHAYLIWAGDILALYAVCGAIAFVAWRWRSRALLFAGICLLLFKLSAGMVTYGDVRALEAAAQAPAASAQTRAQWQTLHDAAAPDPATAAQELAAYRGSYAAAFAARRQFAWRTQTIANAQALPDTLALMLIGMALYRSGFFSGLWSRRAYHGVVLLGFGLCVPLYLPLVRWIDATQFSPVTRIMTEAIQLSLLRPILSLAEAALVILCVLSGRWRWLIERTAAVGRMAFSNYLGTSIVCTLIFNGYGLGWFGYLSRWQCYPVVAGIWALMLFWSKPWLDRFHYGPLEWLWRTLARGGPQKMRRNTIAS